MARKLGAALPVGRSAPVGRPLDILAKRIRGLRAERGLTQEEFASRAGISISFVSMLERGERSPSYETLLQLAEALDVPPGELFRDTGGEADYDDPYFRVLGTFARENHLTRAQVDRLIRVAEALFDLPAGVVPPRRPSRRRRLPGCAVEGCDRPVLARGLCSAHYHAERRARSPE
jgi:transcriptional regulator with XRE-family HTH domain